MLFQWSHSHMQHFSTEQKSHDKKGSRVKKLHCKKITVNLHYVCQGTNHIDTLYSYLQKLYSTEF